MKKLIALVLVLVLLLCLAACGNKLVEGSEKTYYGTVTDRAMSVVNEGDRQGRAYISITTDNEDIQFWLTKDCETNAQIGDKVIIESAIEEQTNLLVATSITVGGYGVSAKAVIKKLPVYRADNAYSITEYTN